MRHWLRFISNSTPMLPQCIPILGMANSASYTSQLCLMSTTHIQPSILYHPPTWDHRRPYPTVAPDHKSAASASNMIWIQNCIANTTALTIPLYHCWLPPWTSLIYVPSVTSTLVAPTSQPCKCWRTSTPLTPKLPKVISKRMTSACARIMMWTNRWTCSPWAFFSFERCQWLAKLARRLFCWVRQALWGRRLARCRGRCPRYFARVWCRVY